MRRPICLLLVLLMTAAWSAQAATGRVIKVLPHLLDLKGQHTVSPSLYDRDAYQAYLRLNTNQISGVRFDVQWKANGKSAAPLKLRVEMRGTVGQGLAGVTLEQEVKPGGLFSHWKSLPLVGEDYQKIGKVVAWRATLWEGDQLLSEQKSFLW